MIGLLDATEDDRETLLRIAAECLVWYPFVPREWELDPSVPRGMAAWIWMDPTRQRPHSVASADVAASVYRLQRDGLLTATLPHAQMLPTRAGVRAINALNADGWQPPDRRPLAIAATVRKAAPRRKRRPA